MHVPGCAGREGLRRLRGRALGSLEQVLILLKDIDLLLKIEVGENFPVLNKRLNILLTKAKL